VRDALKEGFVASYKVVVTGPFNSGKTEFIRTISDIPVVSTEKKITTEDRGIKAETTVAMDYGRVLLDGDTIYLYGTPGQTRFDFMWEILSGEMDAFVVLADSTDPPSFPDVAELVTLFSGFSNAPHLVAANKSDLEGAAKLVDVRRGTRIGGDVTIMPCVATQKSSVRQVLLQVVDLLKKRKAAG
jgi:signal recognition particle receptor subunit beta